MTVLTFQKNYPFWNWMSSLNIDKKELRRLQVLSRDSVTVSVEAVVYYRVSNPTMAVSDNFLHHITFFILKL